MTNIRLAHNLKLVLYYFTLAWYYNCKLKIIKETSSMVE